MHVLLIERNASFPFCFFLPQSVVFSFPLPSHWKHRAASNVSCLPPAFQLTLKNTCPQLAFTECSNCMEEYLQGHLASHESFHSLANEWRGHYCLTLWGVHKEPVLHSLTRSLGCCSLNCHSLTSWPDVIGRSLRQTCLWVLRSGCISHLGIVMRQVQKYVLNAYFVPILEGYGDSWDSPCSLKSAPFIEGGAILEPLNPNLRDS